MVSVLHLTTDSNVSNFLYNVTAISFIIFFEYKNA